MKDVLQRTIFGLNKSYWLRNILIACCFAAMPIFGMEYANERSLATGKAGLEASALYSMRFFMMLNVLLYPYAKFLYDHIWDSINGDRETTWYLGGMLLIIVLAFKYIIRAIIFSCALFLAPFGLAALYFANRPR